MKNYTRIFSFVAVIAAFVLVSTSVNAQTAILVSGNPSCATLNASTDPAFSHIGTDWEFKDDNGVDGASLQPFTNSNGWVLGGGLTVNTNMFISYTVSNNAITGWSLSWNNVLAIDRRVTAIIVKGGSDANVYTYPTGDYGDTGTFVAPNGAGLSHVSFCFDQPTVPSAAAASIGGRVVDRYGRGISSAVLTVVNLSSGETKYAVTNSLGYYSFEGMPVADFYTLSVRHSRYTFYESSATFTLEDNLTNLNFQATR